MSSLGLSELLVDGGRAFTWLISELGQWVMTSSAASLCAFGRLTCGTCGCAPSLLAQGFRSLIACPSLSSLLWFCMLLWVLFSHMVHNLRDGVTPAGRGQSVLDQNEGLTCFLFPFGAVSSCCHCPSGFGHRRGQVLVGSHLCTTDGCSGASHFLLLDGLQTSV